MASDSPIFRYHELDHESRAFRLLRLLPSANFDAEIHCELFESSLDDCPSYEAISYVWGDANITVPIRLHDTTRSVTTNLGLALRYLRLERQERIIWVDALCINQADDLEKGHQVRQMRAIFVGAEQVIVWLGEEDVARDAFQFLSEVMRASADFRAAKTACDSLYARSWWTRMWTLQEVIHDRPVTAYAGSFQMDFDALCDKFFDYKIFVTFNQLGSGEEDLSSVAQSPSTLKTVPSRYQAFHEAIATAVLTTEATNIIYGDRNIRKSAPERKMSLGTRLYTFRDRQCSDPRDKVYALLGMNDSREYELLIDYQLSKEETYTATMAFLATSGDAINWLLQVESPERQITAEGLPSWVPDWSIQQAVAAKTIFFSSRGFSSCKDVSIMHEYNKRTSISNGTLIIPGIYIGLIINVSVVELDFEANSLDYRSLKLFKYNQDPSRDLLSWASEDDAASSPMDMSNSSWGPHWAERGDVIIISPFCSIPLVLRRDGDAYLFVGGCWLIDSELQDEMGLVGLDFSKIKNNPGFSTIMHGSAWDETKVEEFRIN